MNNIKETLIGILIDKDEMSKDEIIIILKDLIKSKEVKTQTQSIPMGTQCFPCICFTECSDNDCDLNSEITLNN